MSDTEKKGRMPFYQGSQRSVKHSAKILKYPDGSFDMICSTAADFGQAGWEARKAKPEAPEYHMRMLLGYTSAGSLRVRDVMEIPIFPARHIPKERRCADPEGEDRERAMRRARANVRRYALANDFTWFVTLTLDQKKVQRKDPAEVVRKLSKWCSNMVQRHGLRYILVPEYHKKGGIHFHGFMNDIPALRAVDSGHVDKQGHPVYNLDGWHLGYTTAIKLYGDYHAAVAYTCKYIGKDSQKIGGRWYYSGGALRSPEEEYADLDYRDILAEYGSAAYEVELPGKRIAVVNGCRKTDEKSRFRDSCLCTNCAQAVDNRR